MSGAAGGSYDIVIVGAGSAGSTLAYRLGEDRDRRILILEAGEDHRDLVLRFPIGIAKVFRAPKYNWSYVSEPEPYVDGRRIDHPRGKLVGGSAAINAMAYVRGHRADYDRLPALGLPGWSYAEMLPYFRRLEDYEGGANAYRGTGGPWHVHINRLDSEVAHAFLAAGRELGLAVLDDYNAAVQEGFAAHQSTIHRGRRHGNAEAFLHPAIERGNVEVLTGARASRIMLENGRATGVSYVHGGRSETVAAGEVILAGGAFNSPQLLMLSGIGPAERLRAAGIAPKVDLPGVGENLWDHPMVGTFWARRGEGYIHRALRADRLAVSLLQGLLFGTGFACQHLTAGTAFVRSAAGQPIPDLQLFCRDGTPLMHEWFPGWRAPAPQAISLNVALVRPNSRGRVTLASDAFDAAPRILNNFLAEPADRAALRSGYRWLARIAGSAAFADVAGAAVRPKDLTGDDEIDAYVRAAMGTIFHPGGSCKVGVDEMAVVDPEFRVRGTMGLRVADASVIPEPIGGNINAAVTVYADRIADIVCGRAPLAPAVV